MGLAPYGEPRVPGRRCARSCGCSDDGGFELDLDVLPPCTRRRSTTSGRAARRVVGTLYSPALAELLGPAREQGRAARRSATATSRARCRRCTRRRSSTCSTHLHERYRLRCAVPRRRLRDELGGQRQGVRALAVPQALRAVGGGRCGRGDRRGARRVASSARWRRQRRASPMDARLLRAGVLRCGRSAPLLEARKARDRAQQAARWRTSRTKPRSADEAAQAIADGAVVGWFQGRMEWGPRALGNRSIVCDPRRADMKDILNSKIKRRESFRPVRAVDPARGGAGVVRDGRRRAVHDAGVPDPRRRSAPLIPAVTHVDGSGRLQTVTRETNPRYYALIEAFRDADRRADGAEHLVQRERAGGVPAGGGAGLLPAHEDGCARDG